MVDLADCCTTWWTTTLGDRLRSFQQFLKLSIAKIYKCTTAIGSGVLYWGTFKTQWSYKECIQNQTSDLPKSFRVDYMQNA